MLRLAQVQVRSNSFKPVQILREKKRKKICSLNCLYNLPLALFSDAVYSLDAVGITDREHHSGSTLRNSASTTESSLSTPATASTTNNTNTTEESSSDPMLSQAISTPPAPILPYVDFSDYYANVERARLQGTLPEGINF